MAAVVACRRCLIGFLPHILDDMAAGRKQKYKLLKAVAKEYRGRIDFVWLEGGAQPELEAAFNLGFGFPAAVLINTKKERFASSRLAFDEAGLTSFVEGLLTGKQGTEPYPADGLPAITEVTASQPTLTSAELSELSAC